MSFEYFSCLQLVNEIERETKNKQEYNRLDGVYCVCVCMCMCVCIYVYQNTLITTHQQNQILMSKIPTTITNITNPLLHDMDFKCCFDSFFGLVRLL